jgi:putative FmdB family regulatory protein
VPIYEYKCEKCGHVFEEWQSGFEERELPCPKCEAGSKRLISNTSFVLKGSGWYVTDYAGKNPSNGSSDEAGGAESNASDAGSADASAQTASSDTDTSSATAADSAS